MNRLTETWLLISAGCALAAWLLSALHALNATGYLVCLGAAGVLAGLWQYRQRRQLKPFAPVARPFALRKLQRRFRRPLPLAFLGLALLAIVGGVLYPTSNYDELTYRLPRVLHWLAEGHWHWIHTAETRLNTRAAGFEFLTAPLLALLRSDRPLFLINALSYLLLPGLVYSVFLRLGVRRRAAWAWMWVLPAGLTFILQAASTGNDGFAAVYALAAVGYALRARHTKRSADLWFSVLAAGLLTGAKASNLPLLLPWAIAGWPSARLLLRQPVASAGVLVLGALASFLPLAVLNTLHCGDWTGSAVEASSLKISNPLVGLVGNAVVLPVENFKPPLLPLPQAVSDRLFHLVPAWYLTLHDKHFEAPFEGFLRGGIATEDGVGLGMGVSLLLVGSLVAAACLGLKTRQAKPAAPGGGSHLPLWVLGSTVAAFLVFCSHLGAGQISRLSAPYYPLLVAAVLRGRFQEAIVRSRWWKWGAAFSLLLALVAVVLTPARPLLPAQTILGWLQAHNVQQPFLVRGQASYRAAAERNDALGPVRALLPEDATVVGFFSLGNDIEPSLWRPYGRRRLVHFLPADPVSRLTQSGVRYVVVSGEALAQCHQSYPEWLSAHGAEAVASLSLTRTFAPYCPYDWHVARLR